MLRFLVALSLLLVGVRAVAANAGGPVVGPDGVLRYPFGERTPPTLQCIPLFVCDLVLEPGETIVKVAVGDSVRWLIAPASSGPQNGATSHVLVKPTEVGLRTNLIVTTNRRSYYLTLVSRKSDPMPRIGFTYPQDLVQAFGAGRSPRPSGARVSQLPDVSLDKLDFAYHMSGDRSLQPLRVFNDGTHTYLQMPAAMAESPIVFAVGDEGDQLINYRLNGRYYIIDGVPDRFALVEGSGKRQRRALVFRGT